MIENFGTEKTYVSIQKKYVESRCLQTESGGKPGTL